MLWLYREALRVRRSDPAFGETGLTWRPSADGVLAFDRAAAHGPRDDGPGSPVRCVANLSAGPVALPPGASVLLASGPLDGGLLPPDTTAWLRIG
jgi:alpha-glucosidase